MGFTGPEVIVDALKTQLQTNLPAKLDALEAGPPLITLPDVAKFLVGDRQVIDTFPALMLDAAPSHVDEDHGDKIIFEHRVVLGVFVTEPDEETLARKLWRYTRAIAEVIADRRAAGAFPDFTVRFDERDWDYSPRFANEAQLFERDAFIEIECWREEARI